MQFSRCHEGMKFEGEKQQATCKADGKVKAVNISQIVIPLLLA